MQVGDALLLRSVVALRRRRGWKVPAGQTVQVKVPSAWWPVIAVPAGQPGRTHCVAPVSTGSPFAFCVSLY